MTHAHSAKGTVLSAGPKSIPPPPQESGLAIRIAPAPGGGGGGSRWRVPEGGSPSSHSIPMGGLGDQCWGPLPSAQPRV